MDELFIKIKNNLWDEGKIYIPKRLLDEYEFSWDYTKGKLIVKLKNV